MRKYKTEFDQPYDITPDSKGFWEDFIRETKQGNPRKAIVSYHKFCLERNEIFNRTIENDLTL